MSFLPVILPTDALIFLIIGVGIAAAWYIRRRPHLMLPWRRLARSSAAMVSLLALSLFLVVGLLDSLHYRPALPDKNNGQTVYSPEVLSVFDWLAGSLRTRTEKTYSAPLAAQLYAMESMETPDGKVMRGFPRLKSGGAHLADPEHELDADVATRVALGAGGGLLVGVLIAIFILSIPRKRAQLSLAIMTGSGPLRAVLIATLVLSACVGAIAALAPAYHVFGTDKVGQDVLYLPAEEYTHRAGHRYGDHTGDAALRRAAGRGSGLFARLGG